MQIQFNLSITFDFCNKKTLFHNANSIWRQEFPRTLIIHPLKVDNGPFGT